MTFLRLNHGITQVSLGFTRHHTPGPVSPATVWTTGQLTHRTNRLILPSWWWHFQKQRLNMKGSSRSSASVQRPGCCCLDSRCLSSLSATSAKCRHCCKSWNIPVWFSWPTIVHNRTTNILCYYCNYAGTSHNTQCSTTWCWKLPVYMLHVWSCGCFHIRNSLCLNVPCGVSSSQHPRISVAILSIRPECSIHNKRRMPACMVFKFHQCRENHPPTHAAHLLCVNVSVMSAPSGLSAARRLYVAARHLLFSDKQAGVTAADLHVPRSE